MGSSVLFLLFVTACLRGTFSNEIKGNETLKEAKDDKVNLGWPNFFNPEKAILRQKEGIAKKKKATASDKESILGKTEEQSSLELLEENRLANRIKDSDGWRDEWNEVDLRIKDGLRGTLVMLTNTTGLDGTNAAGLSQSELKTIEEELSEEYDVYQELSEVSDDGLRLSTPLFRQRYTPSLAKYGVEITFFDGLELVSFLYYGNWCGRGGRIAPVDAPDRCCLERAKCYGRQVSRCPDVWKKPYATMYAWTMVDGQQLCVKSSSTCISEVCACDLDAARCMGDALRQEESGPLDGEEEGGFQEDRGELEELESGEL